MEWRDYDAVGDRDEGHRILRSLVERGRVPFTIHPGDWDWWTFHPDPRFTTIWLIAEGGVAEVALDLRIVSVFGVPVSEAIALAERYFANSEFSIGFISAHDAKSISELQSQGFAPDEKPDPVFERPTKGGVAGATAPEGFVLRNVGGEDEHAARAAAARRAFSNTMDPAEHARRYLHFMRSPAYVRECDIVAIAATGEIASFAIHWPDAGLSLAQFEPVGTDPAFQRRRISRAVFGYSLDRLAERGVRRARVMTTGTNVAAAACYAACGFQIVDRLHSWKRLGDSNRV